MQTILKDLQRKLRSKSKAVCLEAIRDLGMIQVASKNAVSMLIRMLKSKNVAYQVEACISLRNLGIKANQAVPQLIVALGAVEQEVSVNAKFALAETRLGPKTYVPILIKALKSKHTKVVCFAMKELGRLGWHAKRALPALSRLLTKARRIGWTEGRNLAMSAIGAIGLPKGQSIPPLVLSLIKGLNDDDNSPWVADWALRDIANI